jgi:hypothetical protein
VGDRNYSSAITSLDQLIELTTGDAARKHRDVARKKRIGAEAGNESYRMNWGKDTSGPAAPSIGPRRIVCPHPLSFVRVDSERYGRGAVEVNMKNISPLVDPILRMSVRGIAFTLRVGAQNAFAANFHSRRRCAIS